MDSSALTNSGEPSEDPLKEWKEDQKRYMELQEKIIKVLIFLVIIGVLTKYMFL